MSSGDPLASKGSRDRTPRAKALRGGTVGSVVALDTLEARAMRTFDRLARAANREIRAQLLCNPDAPGARSRESIESLKARVARLLQAAQPPDASRKTKPELTLVRPAVEKK